MAIKKPLKGIYVLLVIWGAMIAYMGYTLFFTDVVKVDVEMSTSAANWETENRDLLLAENSARENILINGLCCTNRVKDVLPLSPDALSLQVP